MSDKITGDGSVCVCVCEGRLVAAERRREGWSSAPWVSRLTPVYLCVSQRQSLCSPSVSKSEHRVTSEISRLRLNDQNILATSKEATEKPSGIPRGRIIQRRYHIFTYF